MTAEILVCELLNDYLTPRIGQEVELIASRANTNVVKFL